MRGTRCVPQGRREAFTTKLKNDQLLKSQVDKSAKSVKLYPVPFREYSKHRHTKPRGNYISEDAKYLNVRLVLILIRRNFIMWSSQPVIFL